MAKGEKVPNVDTGANEDGGLIRIQYSNGVQHWYGKDTEGKKTHIAEEAMLNNFGYSKADAPDKPLTPARPEDYVDPVDDGTTPVTRPGDIGSVPIGRPDPGELDPDDLDDDDDYEDDDDEEELDDDPERDRHISQLQSDILFMIKCAAEFEVGGNKESLQQAQERFMEMFDNLAELQGWDEVTRDKRFNLFIDAFTIVVEGRKKSDPSDDDDAADKTPKAEAVAISETIELAKLSGQLEAVRKRLAELNVKASGRIFVGRKLKAELEATRNEWHSLQVLVGAETMRQVMLLDEGDEATLDQRLAGFAQRGATNEAAALADLQASVPVKGFLKWYAKKYNDADKRWKKAILIMPAGIVAGVAAGTVIGAVGGGIMAGLIARGAVKGALSAKMQAMRTRGPGEVNLGDQVPDLKDIDDEQKRSLLAIRAANANWSSSERFVSTNTRENKKRAGRAVAIGAIVGAASGIVANWATDQDWARGSGVGGKALGRDPLGGRHHGGGGGAKLPPGNTMPEPKVPGVAVPIIDGKPFLVDAEAYGLVPKGQGQELINFLHARGLDNGVDIPGFKDLRTWHTADGFSHLTDRAVQAIAEFNSGARS